MQSSLLAVRAVMRAPSAHHNALDCLSTFSAGFAGTLIDAMLQLKKAADSFCIHIVGH